MECLKIKTAVMVHIMLATYVLHNFCLLHDDFNEVYFLGDDGDDDSDGVDMDGHAIGVHDGVRVAEAKRIQLMNIMC